MLREQRFRKIEDSLRRQPYLEIKSLARQLRVSDATVRRDLQALHQLGRLHRTRGGALPTTSETAVAKTTSQAPTKVLSSATFDENLDQTASFAQRAQLRAGGKEAIGRAAANLVSAGQNILMAGGTTCYAAAKYLRHQRVSVVTNSLPTASLLGETLGVDVVVTGGMVYPKHDILIGPQLRQTLDSIRAADWLFMGAAGADAEGFFDSNHWEVEAQRELMQRANKVALLLDAQKFERHDIILVAGWEAVDVLVTDAAPTGALARALKKANVKTIVAADATQNRE